MRKHFIFLQVTIFFICAALQASLPEACPHQELSFPLPTQTPLGFSGEAFLRNLFASSSVTFTWRNGGQTQAQLNFIPSDSTVKVVKYSEGADCITPPPRIVVDGFFTLETIDGQANVRCAATVNGTTLEDGRINVSLCADLDNLPGPMLEYESFTSIVLTNQQRDGIIYRMFEIPVREGLTIGRNFTIATIGQGLTGVIIEP